MQLSIMNARVIALVAQGKARWQLAEDQLLIDMDLSADNLPPGTRLALGSAVIEVTAEPHNGCQKFVARFGLDAMKFVNSPVGKQRPDDCRVGLVNRLSGAANTLKRFRSIKVERVYFAG